MSLVNVIVDDRDNAFIEYNGPWTTGGVDGEFSRTTTGTQDVGASATFKFHGTFVDVVCSAFRDQGTLNFEYTLDSDSPVPFVLDSAPSRGNRHVSLLRLDVPDGDHTLTVTLKSRASLSWWMDYMVFTTTIEQVAKLSNPAPKLTKSILALVDDAEISKIFYSDGWVQTTDLGDKLRHTESIANRAGSTATFKFDGSYVGVYGTIKASSRSTSSFAIDGGSPATLTQPNLGNDVAGQKLFDANLPTGEHTLVITLTDDQEFCLDYIVYRPNTSGQVSSSPSVSGSTSVKPTTTSNPTSKSGQNTLPAIIVGSVAGAIFLIALLLTAFFCLRKRGRETKNNRVMLPPRTSNASEAQPFFAHQSGISGTHPKTLYSQPQSQFVSASGQIVSPSESSYSVQTERERDGGVVLMARRSGTWDSNPPSYQPLYYPPDLKVRNQ